MKVKAKKVKGLLRFFRGAESIMEALAASLKAQMPIVVILAVTAIFAFVWFAPLWAVGYHLSHIHLKLMPKDILDFESGLRATLVQLLGGMAVVIGSFVAYRNVKAVEKNIKVSEEGQITERFTRAIDQLGSEKLEVRLGGIYALERIARDSERDHRTIMEVLSNYVRTRRQLNGCEDVINEKPAGTEIQAIMTVIGRRAWGHEIDGHALDFKGLDLHGLNLQKAFLEELPFDHSNLGDVDFDGAKLEGASFRFACLKGAKLKGLDLTGVDFNGAQLASADLTGCNLTGAFNLNASQVYLAHFDQATMTIEMRNELKRLWKLENELENEGIPPQLVDPQKAQLLRITPNSATDAAEM